MADAPKYPYRVKGTNAVIHHSEMVEGQRVEKDFHEGDTIELPMTVALEHRWQLEPLSDEGRFPDLEATRRPDLLTMRPHEQEQVLLQQKETIQREIEIRQNHLKAIDERIEQVRAEGKKMQEERAARQGQNQPQQPQQGHQEPAGQKAAPPQATQEKAKG